MKKHNVTGCVLVLSISALLLLATGCTPPEDGKMPITTKSKEARQLFLQGRDLFDKLQYQESIDFFKKAIEKDPDFAQSHLYLSFVQPSTKGFWESFNKAKALIDKVSEGERLGILGVEAGANGFPLKQREYYQKLVEAYPEDERVHLNLANNYFSQQEYEQAIAEYKKATELAPDFSTPYNQLGYSYRFLEKYDEAEAAFKKYTELIPDDPNPYDSYAELLLKTGKYDESIEMYKKALEQNPHFVASFIGIAMNLIYQGKYEEARQQLQKLFDLARNDGERRAALFTMTVSYVDEGNTEQALEMQNKQYALAEKINDSGAMSGDLNVMGNILLEAGKPDEAMAKYARALAIIEASNLAEEVKANNRRGFLNNSARVALMKDDIETARAKAVEFMGLVVAVNNPLQIKLAHELMGMICLAEKDFDKALEELKQANQQNPHNLYRMALACECKGDKEKAKELTDKVVKFNDLNSMNYAFIRTKAQQMLKAEEIIL